MEIDFVSWLADCYIERSLTDEEIEEALNSGSKAHDLLKEFVGMNILEWGQAAQEEVKTFEKYYLPRLKNLKAPET